MSVPHEHVGQSQVLKDPPMLAFACQKRQRASPDPMDALTPWMRSGAPRSGADPEGSTYACFFLPEKAKSKP